MDRESSAGSFGGFEGNQQQLFRPSHDFSIVSEGNPFHPVQASNHGLPCHDFVGFRTEHFVAPQPRTEYETALSLAHSDRLVHALTHNYNLDLESVPVSRMAVQSAGHPVFGNDTSLPARRRGRKKCETGFTFAER